METHVSMWLIVLCVVSLLNVVNGDTNQNPAQLWTAFFLNKTVSPPFTNSPIEMARYLSIIHGCMYNTWAMYDAEVIPFVDPLIGKQTYQENIAREAVAYSGWLAIRNIFQQNNNLVADTDNYLTLMGLLPDISKMIRNTAPYVAIKSCKAVIKSKNRDGINENGKSICSTGSSYSDTIGYYPINDAQDSPGKTNCTKLRSIGHWQPALVSKNGLLIPQQFVSVHAIKTKSFSGFNIPNLPLGGPPLMNTLSQTECVRQYDEILKISSRLDDVSKVISEYWYNCKQALLPPGHWTLFAVNLISEKALTLEDSVKLLFLNSNALLDAGLAAWSIKRVFQSARPTTMIQCSHQGQTVKAWSGPYQGVQDIDASQWSSYLPSPPFPDYVSGHSTFSGASAQILQLVMKKNDSFVGKNYFVMDTGSSSVEPIVTDPSDPNFIDGFTNIPNNGPGTKGYSPAKPIKISWDTYTSAAAQAGMSRLYAGIHTFSANVDGLFLGRYIATLVWNRFKRYSPPSNSGSSEDECSQNEQGVCSGNGYCVSGTCVCRPEYSGWKCSEIIQTTEFFVQDVVTEISGNKIIASGRVCAKDVLLEAYPIAGVSIGGTLSLPGGGSIKVQSISDELGVFRVRYRMPPNTKGNISLCIESARKNGYVWVSALPELNQLCSVVNG